MGDDAAYSIGDLSRRTGLSVKAIRFYSDQGLVPPAGRTRAGYRLYGADAVAHLELVQTLRNLGLGLAKIRTVVDRQVPLHEVASVHAEALAAQINVLRLRRAVLLVIANGGDVHRLATLSAAERERLIDDFLDFVFDGLDCDPVFVGVARSLTPELPDDPGPAQLEAWVELAQLTRDPGFRQLMRHLAQDLAAQRTPGESPRRDVVAKIRDRVELSSAADVVLDAEDLARFRRAADPRRERYLELLSVVNGWLAPQSLSPVLDRLERAS